MASACLFCGSSLGRNKELEHYAVGTRLAFDHSRRRLWVVCRRCGQWNLTPQDARWEAIEECERRFRDTTLRLATENIGLTRLPGGTELVRIGAPLRPEFAGWRYGDQFGRRRRRAYLAATAGAGALVGIVAGELASVVGAGAAALGWQAGQRFHQLRHRARGKQIGVGRGDFVTVSRRALAEVRILTGGPWGDSWGLYVPHSGGTAILSGNDAIQGAGILLARINRFGAFASEIDLAVSILERHRSAATCFRWAGVRPERDRYRLARLPIAIRLALEMAAHEETERRILEGELAHYERQWRRAEPVARIADGLLQPQLPWDTVAVPHP